MKSFRSKVFAGKKSRGVDGRDGPDDGGAVSTTASAGAEPDAISPGAVEDGETPEATAIRLVKTFCMTQMDGSGAEVALLPSLVEAAESSPAAAADCAKYIRKFLHRDYWTKPSYVYNAIMLLRILVENPGHTFTRNIDKKFTDAVRDVLRNCHSLQTVQFLIDALQDFEFRGVIDEGLDRLVDMWKKEKTKSKIPYPTRSNRPIQPMQWEDPSIQPWHTPPPGTQMTMPAQYNWPAYGIGNGNGFGNGMDNGGHGGHTRHHSLHGLPRPREVRKRLEEARTTASVLADVVNTSAPSALLAHDLAGDLSARCRRASAQILDYLNAENPIPDNTEMASLLAAHEAVQQSLHHYYRAVLEARKQLGMGETRRSESGALPDVEMTPAGKGKGAAPPSPGVDHDNSNWPSGAGTGTSSPPTTTVSPPTTAPPPPPRIGTPDDLYGADDDHEVHGHDRHMTAALAASTAPDAHVRPSHRYLEAADPFADDRAESSRASSRVRPGRDSIDTWDDADHPMQNGHVASGGGGGSSGSRWQSHANADGVSPIELEDHAAGSSVSNGKAVYRY